jgi:hypothetical protein
LLPNLAERRQSVDWLQGTNPYAGVSTPQKGFPSILPLNEATDWVEEAGPSGVLLGVTGTGSSLTVDLDAESPHILISAPTGRGKSAVARSVAVQRLARGDLVVVLDIKRHSHRWARRLEPNVHYAKSAQDIGGALVNLGRELHRRNMIVDEFDGPLDQAPVGPRIIVIFEEMNATVRSLKALDKRLPEGNYTAQQGLEDLSFMGRAVKMHLVSFAQLASYRASGGSEIIENYGTRILIGHSPQAWRWLASDCGRPMTAPEEAGRGIVCQGGKARETQLLWVPEESAEEYVLRAIPAQRRARELSGSRRNLPSVWRQQIGR